MGRPGGGGRDGRGGLGHLGPTTRTHAEEVRTRGLLTNLKPEGGLWSWVFQNVLWKYLKEIAFIF
jgi:hypothetical protein